MKEEKKLKRTKAILACMALAAALMLGLAVPAFAADAPVVNKTVLINHGDPDLPRLDEVIKFDVEAIELDTNVPDVKTSTDAPLPTIDITSYSKDANGGKITGSTTVQFDTWPHAGTYAWKVSENTGTFVNNPRFQMTFDPQVYTLIADVKNGANPGEYDVNYIIIKGEATSTEGNDGNKVASMDFTNKFTHYISQLTVGKKVTGDGGDLTRQFEFTVTFEIPADTTLPGNKTAADVLNEITYDTTSFDGTMIQDDQVAPGATSRVFKFTAAHEHGFRFRNLMIGTHYSFAETPVAGYTQTAYWTQAQDQYHYESTNVPINYTSAEGLWAIVENEYNVTPPTALILNNLPFILMGLLAVVGLVVYGTVKKKLAR